MQAYKYSKKLFAIILTFIFASVAVAEDLRFVTEEMPPFNYAKNGTVQGFFPDMVRDVCVALKNTCTISVEPWLDAEWQVRRGEANGIFALAYTKERKEWLEFGPPIVQTSYGFFVKKDNPFTYTDPQSLANKGLKIGAYGPSNTFYSLQQIIDEVPDLGIIRFYSTLDALYALEKGEIDMVYSNRDGGLNLAQTYQIPVRYAGDEQTLQYYYAFSKHTDSATVKAFNKTYEQLKKDGKIKAIAEQHGVELVE